jgi:hypothetical protein
MYRTDGGIIDAEIIRPRSWIESHNLQAGKPIPLHLEELQVHGNAIVTSIDPCPEIAIGEGSVVTARYCTREVHTIARVQILGPNGDIEILEGTPIHPVWSEDRQDWVPLGELVIHETLLAADSPAEVLSVTILNQPFPVYNIEVHGEHVYQSGDLSLLVHNTCAPVNGLADVSTLKGRQLASEFSPKAIKRLKKDMKANGFDPAHPIEVVIVDGKMIIWDGHHRARAAGAAGIKKVPIKILEKSPEMMRELFNQAAQAAQQLGLPF